MYQKDIPYAPVKDVDFTSAKRKKMKTDLVLNHVTTLSATNSQRRKSVATANVCPPSGTEIEQFYKALISGCDTKHAVFSVTLPFAYDFQPKTTLPKFQQLLPELFKEKEKHLVMDILHSWMHVLLST